MSTTFDFQKWLDNLEEKDIETIHDLYECITGVHQMGSFRSKRNERDQLFVNSELNDLTLLLSTKEAERAFLSKLDVDYGGDFGWVGGHYDFIRNMNKDD